MITRADIDRIRRDAKRVAEDCDYLLAEMPRAAAELGAALRDPAVAQIATSLARGRDPWASVVRGAGQ